ncbi:MAG: glutaredoxin 3 [Parvibaculum sp.]|uniref:glutaredoxin 3 n=1 Tax=Parvibaculum sp. TaxID=2024848 RepID=UPI0025E933E3|nr:glutaredoxin 3 [Parvibaculum sp.]MCE9651347.1 glutaredoxin 3 [Parvibaculum sp.]
MADVTIYTTMMCPYCHRAKSLLSKKGVSFKEVDVGMDADKRAEMEKRASGGYTVPQIFIGDRHVGGCDDLFALDRAGKLDPLLAA